MLHVKPINLVIDQQSAMPLYEQICAQFRAKITANELVPGTLLPTTKELTKCLNISGKTAQQAMAKLAREGFVARQARRGTIVKGIPRRGVVAIYSYMALYSSNGDHEFYRLITSHISQQLEAHGRVHRMYLGSEMPDTSNTAGEDLLRHLSSGALAGVMLVNTPHQMLDQLVQIGREKHVPVVALSGYGSVDYSVRIDFRGYVRAAAEYLRQAGHKRIGVIYNSSSRAFQDTDVIPNILRETGFVPNPSLIIGRIETEQGGYDAASAMPVGDIDALIVQDDIMATGVDRWLCELGVNVPDDLRVTALWHHGSRMRLTLPFERFEADLSRQARLALGLMQDAIHGQRLSQPHLKIVPTRTVARTCKPLARAQVV